MANEKHLKILKQGFKVWKGWRENNREIRPDLSWADLSGVNLSQADLSGANLSWADLSQAILSQADLSGANLREVNLSRTDLRRADLSGADLSGANLSRTDLREADLSGADLIGKDFIGADLSGADLSGAILRGVNLRGAYLRGANLSGVNLSGAILSWAILSGAFLSEANLTDANLTGANLTKADLSAATLIRTQALKTRFEGVIFTGACIEDWNINSNTNFENVICDYIYLRANQQERRPARGNFEPGDFTRLFQKALETVDLIFREGIDWQSFATAFQGLQNEQRLKIEGENNQFNIRAIETKDDGSFVIRINVPAKVDKAEIEESFKQKYERVLEAREEFFREKLQAKDEQIAIYRQQSADMKEIVKEIVNSQANRPIQNIINTTANSESKSMSENYQSKYDQRQAQIGGIVDTAQTGSKQEFTQHNYASEQNLAEAATEIQQLLEQLSNTYPTITTAEKLAVVNEAAEQIEKNATLKARVINAIQAGGKEALKEAIDHPLVNILMATIEGWQEAK